MRYIFNYLIQVILILWQLPQCLVGVIMIPFLGKLRLIKYDRYCWCFECEYMQGGISLGCFSFLSPRNAERAEIVAHELGHVKQSHYLGFLYLIVIGIPSILNAWLDITECYYDFYTEKWANRLSNLTVKRYNGWCSLEFI